MQQCFCTPVPSRRVSDTANIELRIAADKAAYVIVQTVLPDGKKIFCGRFEIQSGRKLNRITLKPENLYGMFRLRVEFYLENGRLNDTYEQAYEIVKTGVHSTRLIDGCWISIRHWSLTESRYFKDGLEHMSDADWKEHVYGMHKIGVTTVLIQNLFYSNYYVNQHNMTADTYDGEAFYDSKLYRRRPNMIESDPVEALFSAADECEMSVFAGVGMYAWFDFSPESLKWHKRVAAELFERYGHHKSFYGFYISEEIMGALYYGYAPVPDENYKDIQNFFREFSAYIQTIAPTKPVALAPNNIDMHLYQEEWQGILENLDILIPFAFARSENNIPQIAEMCKNCGVHFWVDMEIFKFPFEEGALIPKECDELVREIQQYDILEQIYGYQFTGLLNEPGHGGMLGGERTERLYAQYMDYQKQIRNL